MTSSEAKSGGCVFVGVSDTITRVACVVNADSVSRKRMGKTENQAVVLWRQWKHSGGFWPPQMPDPDDTGFDGPDGTKTFL